MGLYNSIHGGNEIISTMWYNRSYSSLSGT